MFRQAIFRLLMKTIKLFYLCILRGQAVSLPEAASAFILQLDEVLRTLCDQKHVN